jgi:hypothetical protein
MFRIGVYEDDGDMIDTPEQQILSTLTYDSPEVGAEVYRTDQVRAARRDPSSL